VLPAAARDGHFPGGRIGLAASSRSDAGTEANQSVTLQGQGGPSRDSGHPGFFLRTVANHRDQSYNFAPYHSAVILSAAKDLSVQSHRVAIISQLSMTTLHRLPNAAHRTFNGYCCVMGGTMPFNRRYTTNCPK
jgi:hypothetical protein